MKINKTHFKDLFLIENYSYQDKRGAFSEISRSDLLNSYLSYEFSSCQLNLVKSKKNVVRGLHFQKPPFEQSKLITVVEGEIIDVAVDLRKDSENYGKYFSYILSSKKHESIFIPKGFAHGYLTVSNSAILIYQVDNYYNEGFENGISIHDGFLNINWGIDKSQMIISEKDKSYPLYKWKK